MTRLFLLLLFSIWINSHLHAQNLVGSKDCETAPLLCNNDVIIEKLMGPRGSRGFNDIPNNFNSCFKPKTEYNPFWYKFTAENSGTFEMYLNAKQEGVDFDFIIFDITSGCTAKTVLTCNSSQTDQDWNYIGTGISSDSAAFYETDFPDEANSWEPTISLVSGRSYAIYIESRMLFPTDSSFTITFGGSAIFRNINAQFTVPSTNCLGKAVAFSNTSTGSGTLNYRWDFGDGSPISTVANPTHLYTSAGNYKVKLTTGNGYCSDQDSLNVIVAVGFSPSAGNDPIICSGSSTNLNATGGINYNWTPSAGLSATNIPNPVASPASTTTYFLTATDVNGCIGFDTLSIVVNPLPVANAGIDFSICAGNQQMLNGSGGLIYSWSPASGLSATNISNPTASPVATSTYTLTVSDNNNCSATDDVIVTVNTLPVADAGVDKAICTGASTALAATGGNTYTWSPAIGLSSTIIANPNAAPTVTTVYKVTITDENFCSSSDSVTVTVNALPLADAGSNAAICAGSSVGLAASGGNDYTWTPAAGLSDTSTPNPTATPASTTTYTVNVTDANLCSATDEVTITVNALPAVNAGNNATICEGDNTNLVATGTGAFTWSPATGLSSATIANPVASPGVTINYTVSVTDGNSCTASDEVLVTVNVKPAADAGPDATICQGAATLLQASGGINYQWSPAAGLSSTSIADPVANPGSSATYIVKVTGSNGCENTDQVNVTVNPLPVISAGADVAICAGSATNLSASGATNYTWSPAAGLSNTAVSNPSALPSSTTLYTVTGTDGIGCQGQDQILVTVNDVPLVDAGPDVSYCEGATAILNGSGTGTLLWSPAANLSDPTVAQPTTTSAITITYTLTASNGSGCQSTDQMVVTVNQLPVASAGNDVIICQGTSAQLTATGGQDYTWTPALGLSNNLIPNPSASPVATTVYQVTVAAANGCEATDEVQVTVNYLPNVSAGNDTSICNGNAARLHATGGLNYVWTPNTQLTNNTVANPLATPSQSTTYSVIVSDASGCSGTDSVVVTVNYIAVKAFTDTTLCAGASTQLNAIGGAIFNWTPATGLSNQNIANPIATPLSTTQYIAEIEDVNGCKNLDTVTISVIPLPIVSAGNDVALCEGDSTVLLATGGNSYTWLPAINLSDGAVFNPKAFPSTTTAYTVTGVGVNGCKSSDEVVVQVNTVPIADAGKDTSFCLGKVSTLQGSGGIDYQWSPSAGLSDVAISNPVASPVAPTEYILTVHNAAGCSDKDTILVNVTYINIKVSNDTSLCLGQKTQLKALGGTTVLWTPSLGLSNPLSDQPDASPLSTTTYLVTVTDTNGCNNTDSVLVKVNYLITSISNDTTLCMGQGMMLQVTGGATQVWSPSTGLTDPTAKIQLITPVNDITYTATSTDLNGCQNIDTINIKVNSLPSASAGKDTTTCNGNSVMLNAAGSGSLQWSPVASLSSGTITNPIALPGTTTTYILSVTDGNGCMKQDSVTVQVSYINITHSNDTTICTGQTVPLRVTGGAIYQWSPSSGLSDANSSNPTATTADTTVYSVEVTDTNGCKNSGSVTINVHQLPIANAGPDVSICRGSTAQLNASGGNLYVWSPALTLSNATVANPLASPANDMEYTVQVKDDIGCTSNDTIQVKVVLSVNGTAEATPLIFCAGQPVRITAKPGMGVVVPANPFSFDGGMNYISADTFDLLSVKNDTTVHVIIKDAAGCLSDSIQLNLLRKALNADLVISTPAACTGSASGTVLLNSPSGGQAPYSYVLNGTIAQTSSSFDSLPAGNHVITMYDALGCTEDFAFIMTTTTGFTSQASRTDLTCFNKDLGSISVSTQGGSGKGFSYALAGLPYQAENQFDSLPSGNFTVIVRDSAMCFDTIKNITITSPPALLLFGTSENVTCTGAKNGSISLEANGGSPDYRYSIDGMVFQTETDFNNLSAGAYTLTAEDENGCSTELPMSLNEPSDTLSATLDITQLPACNGVKGTITISNIKGENPGSYWRTIDNGPRRLTNDFTDLLPGSHIIRIIDSKECYNDFSITIPADSNSIKPPGVKLDSVTCFGRANGAIYIAGLTGGTRPFQLSLMDENHYQSDSTFTNLRSGNYKIFAKNSNQCVSLISVTIPSPDSLFATLASKSEITCFNANNGALEVRANGGTPAYQFAINQLPFTSSGTFTSLAPGTDTVRIIDSKGCASELIIKLLNPDSITVRVAATLASTCTANDGEARVIEAYGGMGTLRFSIDGGETFQTNSTLRLLGSGIYTLLAKDAAGCTNTTNFTINQKGGGIEVDSIKNEVTDISCNNANEGIIRLTNVFGGKLPYQYSIDSITAKVGQPVFDGLAAGMHKIHITDGAGCFYEINLEVKQPTQVNFTLSVSKKETCNSQNGVITAHNVTGGKGNYVFSIDGKSFQDLSVFDSIAAGRHSIEVKDGSAGSCKTTKSITMEAMPVPDAQYTRHDPLCFGTQDGYITIDTVIGGVPPYEFSLNGSEFSSQLEIKNLRADTFKLSIKDGECPNIQDLEPVYTFEQDGTTIKDTSYVPYFVLHQPDSISAETFSVDADRNIRGGIFGIYNIQGGTAPYFFSLNDSVFSPVVKDTILVEGVTPGDYYVYLQDSKKCPQKIRIYLGRTFYIPNLFTPNGDGKNEYFEIMALRNNSSLVIFNRWGSRVYTNLDYDNSWNGEDLPDGLYYYELQVSQGKQYKGWVQIMR